MESEGRLRLPLAADIYDLETEQLHEELQRLDSYLGNTQSSSIKTPEQQEDMENANYIRGLITTEIEERRSVESFGKMCMNYKPDENPFDFLRQFDDFNRQLQRLVEQANTKPNEQIREAAGHINLNKNKPPTTASTVNSNEPQQFRPELMTNSSHYTLQSSDKSVKMGLNNKKRKSGTSEMMMKLLARTKVGGDKVVVGKGSQMKKLQADKHHPPRPHPVEHPDQPLVRHQQSKQSKTVQHHRKIDDNKPKTVQPADRSIQKPKLPSKPTQPKPASNKITSNKELLDMIRQDQQEKKNKETTKRKNLQNPTEAEQKPTAELNVVMKSEQLIVTRPAEEKPSIIQQIPSEPQDTVEVEAHKLVKAPTLFSQEKEPFLTVQPENNGKTNAEINLIKEEEIEESVAKDIVKLSNLQDLTVEARLAPQKFNKPPEASLTEQFKQLAETRIELIKEKEDGSSISEEIKEEAEEEEQRPLSGKHFELKGRLIRNSTASSQKSANISKISNQDSKIIEPSTPTEDEINSVNTPKEERERPKKEDKECYSEEYWNNVRQQANQNLEKMKKMRQERQLERVIVNDQVNKAMSEMEEYKARAAQILSRQDTNQTQPVKDKELAEQDVPPNQEPVEKDRKPIPNIQKPKKQKKKEEQPQVIIQRTLPDYIEDYLCHYPSFSHLFSVYYMKPIAEAVLDINVIMKEMYALFSIHREVMESNSYRKPLFTPFDNNNTVYINEPRQLLAHAQTTHIDIKKMIARLSVFNENLHGRFDDEKDTMSYRVVRNREQVYDIVTTTFLRVKGWRELPHGMNMKSSWNLFWTWAKPELDLNKLLVFQKVNHFPLNKNISRKDLLYKNMENLRRLKVSVPFMPLTYNLPKEFSQFSAKFHDDQMLEGANNIWIMKPIGKSRGRGIKLINNIADLSYVDNIVVQKYLRNPLLLDGYKFDMRIYVLVTSIHPLEAFVYRQGFARLSTEKFTMNADSIKNTFIHLTNFAIQKNNRDAAATFEGGSKISFKSLQEKLEGMGVRWQVIWDKVHDIIVKSLLACSMGMPRFPSAFELFGYDIMIDDQLNCYLIEVNSSPSLERSYMIDELIKQSLIDDIIELLSPPNFDRKQCCQIFTERLARKTPMTPREDNIDIARILRFKPLRRVGELPEKLGLFQRVAPQKRTEDLERMVQSRFNPNVRYLDN